ncbi:NUDIX hydrolase [Roseomonas populi]|uniref:NUDIX hydrolase n=1 Tax=Roseomonas populi TaxID=3121582 RepID=A0ABT1XC64_9PROT|nr:NUDIX hydrolase [Roseomonas pecuniae]MCR0985718.1 NUDIX hydrolase [Roseomonas pecuniae]
MPLRRQEGEVRVLLLTSRGTGRWVLPKGWAEEGLTGAEVAAKEAFEEAGLVGEVQPDPLGVYSYVKAMPQEQVMPCRVEVFALWVGQQLGDWPEREQRVRRWFSLSEAAGKVHEDDLRLLLERLAAQYGAERPSV